MKEILVYNDGSVLGVGQIELGIFENDPNEESYKITLEDGTIQYALARNYVKYEVEEVPENINGYIYNPEDGFIKIEIEYNEQKILELEQEIARLKAQL